jgi:hypothetical protein
METRAAVDTTLEGLKRRWSHGDNETDLNSQRKLTISLTTICWWRDDCTG